MKVVVGDFDPSTMKSYVESYFGSVDDEFEGSCLVSKSIESKNLK